jgi:single-strand DNA-binding protein
MNKVVLMGRLTRDIEVRYSQGDRPLAVARYTLAVPRRFKREGEQDADFINCVAFGKNGEFAEKYFRKGMKVVISGRIQTGSYTNRDGQKVYTTDIVIEEQDFAESKNASGDENRGTYNNGVSNGNSGTYGGRQGSGGYSASNDGFMSIPDSIEEDLPFH